MKLLFRAFLLCVTLMVTCTLVWHFFHRNREPLKQIWHSDLKDSGFSSPLLLDINEDETPDIVIGSGREYRYGKVSAIDGKTGSRLWQIEFSNEIYTSPITVFSNHSTETNPRLIVVAGRIADIVALDPDNGGVVWTFKNSNPTQHIELAAINTPVPLQDVDQDGYTDLLAIQSGGRDRDRPPGEIFILSGRSGKMLGRFLTPDHRETYAVPAVYVQQNKIHMILGTGGETLGGQMFHLATSLTTESVELEPDVLWQSQPENLGYIASPIWVDPGNGASVIINASHDGVVSAWEADSGKQLWRKPLGQHMLSASPAIYQTSHGKSIAVVCSFLKTWPIIAMTTWIDIESGSILEQNFETGSFGIAMIASSPVITDFDGDDFPDTVIFVTEDISQQKGTMSGKSKLVIYSGKNYSTLSKFDVGRFSLSTPSIVTSTKRENHLIIADNDGLALYGLPQLDRMQITSWTRYRGKNQDGIFRTDR